MTLPSSTYRLQLRRSFGFAEARAVAPYLAELGVSHLYLSPVTMAVPGSEHGYDVVDPTRLNPDLGGEREYRLLVQELARLGLGQVIDIVPNHMGITTENRWWGDVLRRGEASPYARIYDIDWQAPTSGGQPRVLLPVLGERLERVLERGEITFELTPEGDVQARYFELALPLATESLALLAPEDAPVDALRGAVEALSARRETEEGRAQVHALLDAQHYRLEWWRDAKPRVNYRRFFVIDQLVGVRAEDPAVFGVTHALALRLASEGAVDGLRIDHVDGLADPAQYLERLQEALAAGADALEEPRRPYVVVEKILAPGEALPASWRCDGTTGYDFMRDVNGVFVDPAGEPALTETYRSFTGETAAYKEVAYAARRGVVEGPLAGQLRAVSGQLFEASGAASGITPGEFDEALRTLLACMDVYRTYHSAAATDAGARAHVEHARDRAARRLDARTASALTLVTEVLAQPQEAALPAIERLQQLMPTVQAKGIEDCAAYRYPRLLSLNEVGASPGDFGIDVATFHARNAERRRDWPASMLATATHDHKRGEDVRARLNVLAELPQDFAAALARWRRMTAAARDRHITPLDEYVVHQVLLGSWPAQPPDDLARAGFAQRVQAYLLKFAREAGTRTTWEAPDEAYEESLRICAARLLDPAVSGQFLADRAALQERVSALGALNSLGQVVLRLASPGVPDTYQGTERWDLSLVDPDNRRPVPFEAHAEALRELLAPGDGEELATRLLARWQDGAVKQFVLARSLRHRRERGTFYLEAEYVPLEVRGQAAAHVVAFARVLGPRVAVVAVTRLPGRLLAGAGGDLPWPPSWADTTIRLPGRLSRGSAVDLFTGRAWRLGGELPLSGLLGTLPVAWLA